MKIEPANAKRAVESLYQASRQNKLTADEHDLHRTCRDGLMLFIDEAAAFERTTPQGQTPKKTK